MTVEMFIRTLGYIVYCILWSPIVVVLSLIMPIVWLVMFTRMGMTVKETMALYWKALKNNIRHDMEFIRTGVWY